MEETMSTTLIDLKKAKPRLSIDKIATTSTVTTTTDRQRLLELLASLDNIRLTLKDSEGQGFLINAASQIRTYLQYKTN